MGDWLVSLLKATAPYQQKKSKRSANIGGRVILATRTQVNTLDETSRPTATLGTNYTILGADHHLLGWGETGDFRRLITFIILNLRLWRNASSASLAIIVSEDRARSQIRHFRPKTRPQDFCVPTYFILSRMEPTIPPTTPP